MKTTLKRGIGRGAAVNGNGRAVYPPIAPTPMRRYRWPEPRRRGPLRLVGTFVGWVFAVVVMIAAGLGGGAYLFFDASVSAVVAHTPSVKLAAKRLAVTLPGRPAIALIVGEDKRAGIEKNLGSRSDTLMLLRADPQTHSISMLSFPRDLVVDIRCPGRPVYQDRINAAYSDCGLKGTLETVKSLTGLPINYLITVDFHGFKQIVDKLGGIWVDVDRRYYNRNVGTASTNYANINLEPGYQKLNGSDALDYVRFRHTDNDLYRLARQQQFVQGIKEQVAHSFAPTSLPKIIRAITSNAEVAEGGGKAISGKTILRYALFAYGLPAGHFFRAKVENLTGQNELYAPPEAIAAAVRDFSTPDVEAPASADAAALGRRLRRRAPRPQDVPVMVLNGNGVAGSASNAAYLLQQRGYPIVTPAGQAKANAPTFDYFTSIVYYVPEQKGSKLAATKVANLFGDAGVKPVAEPIRTLSNGAMLVVVVGQTFHGNLAPAPIERTPKHEPPSIVHDPSQSLTVLKKIRRRLPFRLEVPTILERTSHIDTLRPIRVYRIHGHDRAVRVTFKTGIDVAGYWGIEETAWDGAPVLGQPSFKRTLKGREFDLYYSGPHLHMVVLRENGASFWVVNTLLDALSNETMLAIAKGLHPLNR